MPGYHTDDIDIDAKFLCKYCGMLLRDAMQTQCGHFFCQSCLGNLRRNGAEMICSVDQDTFLPDQVFPNNFMRREIRSLIVPCTHWNDGCTWKGEVQCLEQHLQRDCPAYPAGQEEIHRQVAALRRELETLQETIRELEVTSYDGVQLWKISDYAQRRNDATTGRQTVFCSPCFYTSRFGYKMCARLYLNGDGMGKGTHISLFFIVIQGQYDGVLRWPFRQKVTMMLLDQDNEEHVLHAFTPDPDSSSFRRPGREMNVPSGFALFCPLAELNNHAYVRDDTMFLKIIVDTSGL